MSFRNSMSSSQSEDNSASSSAALFYLTSTNYSEVESAYLTSEEVGYNEDEYDFYNNGDNYNANVSRKGGVSTPKCSNSRYGGSSSGNGTGYRSFDTRGNTQFRKRNNGQKMIDNHQVVRLNPLLSSLLGIDVLPRMNKQEDGDGAMPFSTNVMHFQNSSRDTFSSDGEEDEEEEEEEEYDDDDDDDDKPIDLGASMSHRTNHTRKRGPIRRLRRRIAKNTKEPKHQKHRHNRKARGKVRHHELIHDASTEIDRNILQVEMTRKRLQSVKSDLKFTQSRAKKLMLGAQQSANRVSKISKTILELECKLDLSLRALEQERDAIDKNLAKLAHLNALEKDLKDQAMEMEGQLRVYYLERGEREGVPATQLFVSMNGTGNHQLENGIVSDATPNNDLCQPQHSFLRIHDLEINDMHLKSKGNNRPDLFPIHSNDDSHHALNALMKLALKYATDESSRWTPDRGTENIISKRPISDQNWHYATDSDIFVWYGKLDTSYKSELPVIKARAMIRTSARNLLELLVDSSKVKQYNKMSLGREDKAFIKQGLETNNGLIKGEAKIVRSLSNVPMIRKKLELISLLYARQLDENTDGVKGYIIVNRSVWEDENRAPTEDGDGGTASDCNYIRSEILLGVNLIRDIGQYNKCEITTVSHFYTPGTPTFGARQFGMKAASNFLRDLQNHFQ
mmetsp:Transcript_3761/g.7190  ORF Transcript_3761/g.7190 Transcript_3761/m.7190 type:complete len:680 (-) Transcript_3761:905-2944(-)